MAKYGIILSLIIGLGKAYAFHMTELTAGTGNISGKHYKEQSLISVGKQVERTTTTSYPENFMLGIRHLYFSPLGKIQLTLGGEFSFARMQSSADGSWIIENKDSKDAITSSTSQKFSAADTPDIKNYKLSGLVGLAFPVTEIISLEAGLVAGISTGDVSYNLSYSLAGSSGSANGHGGAGFHGGLRAALRFYLGESISISGEYRYIGEFFGVIMPFLPIAGNYDLTTLSYNQFSASVGYRW